MIKRRERGIEALVMIENGAGAIYIERCAELLRGASKIDIFAAKFAVAVAERVHPTL